MFLLHISIPVGLGICIHSCDGHWWKLETGHGTGTILYRGRSLGIGLVRRPRKEIGRKPFCLSVAGPRQTEDPRSLAQH